MLALSLPLCLIRGVAGLLSCSTSVRYKATWNSAVWVHRICANLAPTFGSWEVCSHRSCEALLTRPSLSFRTPMKLEQNLATKLSVFSLSWKLWQSHLMFNSMSSNGHLKEVQSKLSHVCSFLVSNYFKMMPHFSKVWKLQQIGKDPRDPHQAQLSL